MTWINNMKSERIKLSELPLLFALIHHSKANLLFKRHIPCNSCANYYLRDQCPRLNICPVQLLIFVPKPANEVNNIFLDLLRSNVYSESVLMIKRRTQLLLNHPEFLENLPDLSNMDKSYEQNERIIFWCVDYFKRMRQNDEMLKIITKNLSIPTDDFFSPGELLNDALKMRRFLKSYTSVLDAIRLGKMKWRKRFVIRKNSNRNMMDWLQDPYSVKLKILL